MFAARQVVLLALLGASALPAQRAARGWSPLGRHTHKFAVVKSEGGARVGVIDGSDSSWSGGVQQLVNAAAFRGMRLRISAEVRAQNIRFRNPRFPVSAGGCGVTVMVDTASDTTLYGRTMAVTGTSGWTPTSVVFDVPDDAVGIAITLSLQGSGKGFIRKLRWQVVDDDRFAPTRPTRMYGAVAVAREKRLRQYRAAPGRLETW